MWNFTERLLSLELRAGRKSISNTKQVRNLLPLCLETHENLMSLREQSKIVFQKYKFPLYTGFASSAYYQRRWVEEKM